MKCEHFMAKYANTHLNKRFKVLTFDDTSPIVDRTLDEVYFELKKIEDTIRPFRIRREVILKEIERLKVFN